jgi:hypothetical protein
MFDGDGREWDVGKDWRKHLFIHTNYLLSTFYVIGNHADDQEPKHVIF